MVAKMATAIMISSSVNASRRLAGTIHIKFHLLRLFGAAPCPLRDQSHSIEAAERRSVVFLEVGRTALLDQSYHAVTGVHVKLLLLIWRTGGCLYFRHPIRQNLSDPIFLRV